MAAAPLALEAGRKTFENLTPEQLDELRRNGVLPYQAGETYARPSPSGSLTAAPPANPVDRYILDSDWVRSLKPEAQQMIRGATDLAPPTAAARGGYDLGAGAASGDVGQTVSGALNALPEVGPAVKAAGVAAVPAIRRAAKEAPELVRTLARDERGGVPVKAPAPAQALPELERLYSPAAPAILRDEAEAATDAIFRHAERPENLTPKYPPAKEPVFELGPDLGRQATLDRVSQESIRDRLPGPEPGRNKPLPVNDRARIIQDKSEELGTAIANDLREGRGNVAKQRSFYYTGPVLEGLENKAGMSTGEAVQHMRDWSGQGSGTSPRTKTPPNLRNASYLLWRDRQGFPLDAETRAAEGNLPGFPMMDMHANLSRGFAEGTHDYWRNPKPGTFQGNWAGNMADVTGDTHYIRGTLGKLDDIYKGKLPREWFTSDEAFKAYKDRGGFAPGKLPYDLSDKLPHEAIKGRKRQTEYGIMTEPGYIAARQLGIQPAEAQAQMWFHYGPRTGLRSPESSIPDLLNSQIEETARATGLHPEKILQFWSRGRIPLAANEGAPSSSAVG